MKNIVEDLERYYKSFLDQPSDWHFFLGLSYYVKFTLDTPETRLIVEEITQQRQKEQEILKDYLDKAEEDIKKAKDKLFKRLRFQKISYDVLQRLIKEYQDHEEGKIISSLPKAISLYELLTDIIRNLIQNGYKSVVEWLFDEKDVEKNITPLDSGYITKFSFSKYINLYEKQEEIFNYKALTEIWGAWNNLYLVFLVIEKREEELQKLNKDKMRFWDAFNFSGLIGEMNRIREKCQKPHLTQRDSKPIHFIRQDYIGYATNFHNLMIKTLEKIIAKVQARNITETKFTLPFFDKNKGILCVQDKEIRIKKFTDQYYMLELIFRNEENKNKDWQYSEIQEFIDHAKPSNWKRLYDIAYALKMKIAVETGIKDFFITTTQSVKINPKYLNI